MMFSERFGHPTDTPPRTIVEADSEDLRLVLWETVLIHGGRSALRGYQRLLELGRLLPDASVWSTTAAQDAAAEILRGLSWTETYEFLEAEYRAAAPDRRSGIQQAVNEALARSGIAYEMRAGRFEYYEPSAVELGTLHDEDLALDALTDDFEPVRAQYANALARLRRIPPDLEGAVGDALNALEAVGKITTGDLTATLSKVVPKLFPDGEGYHEPLRKAIEKLYAYSNQLPGARHGRYAKPSVAYAETAMVVRLAGAIIVFLITLHRAEGVA